MYKYATNATIANPLGGTKIDPRGGAKKSPWSSNGAKWSIRARFYQQMSVLNWGCQNLENEGLDLEASE